MSPFSILLHPDGPVPGLTRTEFMLSWHLSPLPAACLTVLLTSMQIGALLPWLLDFIFDPSRPLSPDRLASDTLMVLGFAISALCVAQIGVFALSVRLRSLALRFAQGTPARRAARATAEAAMRATLVSHSSPGSAPHCHLGFSLASHPRFGATLPVITATRTTPKSRAELPFEELPAHLEALRAPGWLGRLTSVRLDGSLIFLPDRLGAHARLALLAGRAEGDAPDTRAAAASLSCS